MQSRLRNRTTRFLTISLVAVLALSVMLFSFLAIFLNEQSASTIQEVSRMYMSGISDQLARHFETVIRLRLDQLGAMLEEIDPEKIHYDPGQRAEMIANARAREFNYLGFYRQDDGFEMLYGSMLTVPDPASFLKSLSNGEKKVAVGVDEDGNEVVLLGYPAVHSPTEEHPCVAIVAGLPASYIIDTLSLDENIERVYSFIIREDGSFVIRTSDAERDSYFDRVHEFYEEVDGGDPEAFIQKLSAAMAAGEDFAAEIRLHGELRQM